MSNPERFSILVIVVFWVLQGLSEKQCVPKGLGWYATHVLT